MKIFTTKGLVEADRLTITDVVSWEGPVRKVATEYRLEDELVKRTVHEDDMAFTSQGRNVIPIKALEIIDTVTWLDNSRNVVVEARYQGDMVKRSFKGDMLRPVEAETELGKVA